MTVYRVKAVAPVVAPAFTMPAEVVLSSPDLLAVVLDTMVEIIRVIEVPAAVAALPKRAPLVTMLTVVKVAMVCIMAMFSESNTVIADILPEVAVVHCLTLPVQAPAVMVGAEMVAIKVRKLRTPCQIPAVAAEALRGLFPEMLETVAPE
jgi:hypothetical protein